MLDDEESYKRLVQIKDEELDQMADELLKKQ